MNQQQADTGNDAKNAAIAILAVLLLIALILLPAIGSSEYSSGHNDGYSSGWNAGEQDYNNYVARCGTYPFLLLDPNQYWACPRPQMP